MFRVSSSFVSWHSNTQRNSSSLEEQIPINFQLYHKFALISMLFFIVIIFRKNVCITINLSTIFVCDVVCVCGEEEKRMSLCEICQRGNTINIHFIAYTMLISNIVVFRYFFCWFRLFVCFIWFIYWHHCGMFFAACECFRITQRISVIDISHCLSPR